MRIDRTEVKAPVVRPRQPPVGEARRRRLDLGRAAVPHHRGRRDRSRGRRARAVAGPARRRHAGGTQAARRRRRRSPAACASSTRKSTRRAAPARCGSRSTTSATPISAPSPRARSSSRAATASALPASALERDGDRGAARRRPRRQGRGAASDAGHRQTATRWRSGRPGRGRKHRRARRRLPARRATACGRRPKRPQPAVRGRAPMRLNVSAWSIRSPSPRSWRSRC